MKVLSHKQKVHQNTLICCTQFLMMQNWVFYIPGCLLCHTAWVAGGAQHPTKNSWYPKVSLVPQNEQLASINYTRNVSTSCRIPVVKVEMRIKWFGSSETTACNTGLLPCLFCWDFMIWPEISWGWMLKKKNQLTQIRDFWGEKKQPSSFSHIKKLIAICSVTFLTITGGWGRILCWEYAFCLLKFLWKSVQIWPCYTH